MLIFLVVVYARNTYAFPPWWNRRYMDMYDWNHAASVDAAIMAGHAPPPGPRMPLGVRFLNGLIGPPRGESFYPPHMEMPGHPMMRGVTPMPQFGAHMHPPMWPPPMQPGMTGMAPMHPTMTGMPPPMHPGMTGVHPPMQPGMMGMQPPLHPAATGMPPLHPAATGMPPLQPMPTGLHPSMQPGLAPHFTGRPRTVPPPTQPMPAPYPPEFGGMPPGQRPHPSWSGSYGPLSEQAREQARQEVIDIMRPYSQAQGHLAPLAPGMTGPVPGMR